MITEATAGLIGALGSAGLGLISQHMTNKANQQRQNEANQLTKENLEWQKQQYFDQKSYNEALQNKLFEREDSSYERTKDDLLKAGYSPLAINGTNDAGTVVGQPSVPELPNINPFQANSLNFGQFADILGQAQNRKIQERALDIQEEKNLSDKEQRKMELQEKVREFDNQSAETFRQFNEKMAEQIREFDKTDSKKAEQLKIEKGKLDNLNSALELNDSKFKVEQIQNTMEGLTGVKNYPIEYLDDDEATIAVAQARWKKDTYSWLMQKAEERKKTPKQHTENANISIIGTGGGFTANELFDFESIDKAEWLAYANKNPYPMSASARPKN